MTTLFGDILLLTLRENLRLGMINDTGSLQAGMLEAYFF